MRILLFVTLSAIIWGSNAHEALAYHPNTITVLQGDSSLEYMLGGAGPGAAEADENCTQQNSTAEESSGGILSQTEIYLKQMVDAAMITMFHAIIFDSRFIQVVSAALTLMVVIFGVMFMIGMVQLTLGQALTRLFKIAIVMAVTGFTGWFFFSANFVCFFVGGGDEIIQFMLSQTTGVPLAIGTPYIGPCGIQFPVFASLDVIFNQVIKPETMAKLLAALTTGPYGLAMGGLMMISTFAFIKLVVKALEIYAVSYVVRALMFGLAPIFVVCLLFERTKGYFTSWLNAVINFTLQPVLLFIMLAFMMDLIDQASKDMLGVEVCWAEFQSSEGSPNKMQFWRFAGKDGAVNPSEYDWQGQVICKLDGGTDCKPFPIDIIDVLSFVFLIFFATRFAEVIPQITSNLSNIYISLDQGARVEQLFDNMNKKAFGAVGGR